MIRAAFPPCSSQQQLFVHCPHSKHSAKKRWGWMLWRSPSANCINPFIVNNLSSASLLSFTVSVSVWTLTNNCMQCHTSSQLVFPHYWKLDTVQPLHLEHTFWPHATHKPTHCIAIRHVPRPSQSTLGEARCSGVWKFGLKNKICFRMQILKCAEKMEICRFQKSPFVTPLSAHTAFVWTFKIKMM